MAPRRIVVAGTLASDPYAGMAWMHMQIVAGLRRLGHDAYYMEVTSVWPYDPVRVMRVQDSGYAVPYLARVARGFGLGDRWAYRRSYADKEWLGIPETRAEELLASADAVLNVTGTTRFAEEGLKVGRLVYLGTDPVYPEIRYAQGDEEVRRTIEEHDDVVTYGENIGTARCRIPPLPRLRTRTRQPVLLDDWKSGAPARHEFTTVGNWRQGGRDVQFAGETYHWSKHREFLRFVELPTLTGQPLELAIGLADPSTIRHGPNEAVPALGLPADDRRLLQANGWQLANSHAFSTDPWAYRDYIVSSRGEFTVARDLNVRLRSGWFSERSACYLAAGRPVITQDTGFGSVLPTGEGLFAFNTVDEILAAFEAVNSDYERHSRAARAIAEEFFRAETVLAKLLMELGL
jgi:hypothetical protein